MKMLITLFLFATTANFVFAETLVGRVESIDNGEDEAPHIIMLSSGRTVFLDGNDKEELNFFEDIQREEQVVEVEIDENNSYISAKNAPTQEQEPYIAPTEEPKMSYIPTIMNSVSEASGVFQKMRRNYQNNSQCYNRAHIWTYEEFKRSGLKSMKLFMFFTRKYIRNYRYHWWFHVTPMVYVQDQERNMSVEMTLDRRFTREPLSLKNWTDVFIYSRKSCPIVQKYSDYEDNQEAQDCYLIPVSMYFWQPRDILNRDQTGKVKTEYINSEVNWAYREAF